MGFDDRDTNLPRTGSAITTVEEVIFTRDRSLPGIELRISTSTIVDGQRVLKQVPSGMVDTAWPGTSKTLKAHLLSIIDAAQPV